MAETSNREGDVRRVLIDADLVDHLVAFSGRRFYSPQISLYFWFVWKSEPAGKKRIGLVQPFTIQQRQ